MSWCDHGSSLKNARLSIQEVYRLVSSTFHYILLHKDSVRDFLKNYTYSHATTKKYPQFDGMSTILGVLYSAIRILSSKACV